MSAEHPLATRLTVRLRDCANYPVALPERSLGGRQLLDQVVARSGLTFQLAAESNSFEFLRGLVTHANLISFQIGIGTLPENNKLGLVARDIDDRDVPRANLVLGQLRARNLPISGGYIRGKARARARGDAGETRRIRRIRCGSGVRQSLKQESRIDGQNVARRT